MMDFSTRSLQPELLDLPGRVNPSETRLAMQGLRQVNTWLGGTRAVLKTLKPILRTLGAENRVLRIVDLGAGSADIAAAVLRWAQSEGISLQLVAIDRNQQACQYALESFPLPALHLIQADAFAAPLRRKCCDLLFCSSFLHHFPDAEIQLLLQKCITYARHAVIVVDLHRHWLAYAGIHLANFLFSRSKVVDHDGPLSVLKAFRRQELHNLLSSAARSFTLRRRWAFRFVAVLYPGIS
ncbi:MAG: methyltransferase domain-containing protein [Acidobacteria bacterium]|nr:methyltransferase domain-containing protein [Acidobacteriota bacterium]